MIQSLIKRILIKLKIKNNNIKDSNVYCLEYDKAGSRMLHTILCMITDSKVIGNFAELGVYKGDTAVLISQYAKDRDLYLFDTFNGFSSLDIKSDTLDINKIDDFTNTSEKYVKNKIIDSNGYGNIIIKKGYFPETTEGLENENFAFVHLDADLKEPILAGLNFFWTRLVRGGVIIVHDYNSKKYPSVKEEVDNFFANKNVNVHIVMGINVATAIIFKYKE